jgi:hypothetical protein
MMRRSLPAKLLYPGCPVNWQSPLNRGLESWWRVLPGRAGGTRWWDLCERAHGTLVGVTLGSATSGWTAMAPPGGAGGMRLDGTNDKMSTGRPLSQFVTAAAGTITVWARPVTTGPSAANTWSGGAIVADGDGGGGGNYLTIVHATIGGTDAIWVANFTSGGDTTFPIPYTVGAWVHIGWVHDGSTLYAYKNGKQVGSVATADTLQLQYNFCCGTTYTGSPYFQGDLDDVRIGKRALGAPEMAALYRASSQGYPDEIRWQPWPPLWGQTAATKAPPPPRRAWRVFRRAA